MVCKWLSVCEETIGILYFLSVILWCSATLRILTLYWTSFRPLQVHVILLGMVFPFLDELHLYRCSVIERPVSYMHVDPSTTALPPSVALATYV